MYSFVRSLLFMLPPDVAHDITLSTLKIITKLGLSRYLFKQPESKPIQLFGLSFKNRVGLSAGLDNNGDFIEGLAALGFGFLELGGVTPKPQPGNPKPRVFRFPKQQAIINRVGFPNKGVDYLVERLQQRPRDIIIGVNIAKNKDTPLEKAVDDYATCIKKLNGVADYITVNISSPNTPGLRELQSEKYLDNLLASLKKIQAELANHVPLFVKISPDLSDDELNNLAKSCLKHQIEGLVSSNTTLSRAGVDSPETGGMSGKPLLTLSNTVLEKLHTIVGDKIPIIAVGGIFSAEDAQQKFKRGASLVQIYTGLIYVGPSLINNILENKTSSRA